MEAGDGELAVNCGPNGRTEPRARGGHGATGTPSRWFVMKCVVLALPLWAPVVLWLLPQSASVHGGPFHLALPAIGFLPLLFSRRILAASKAFLFLFYYPTAFLAGLLFLLPFLSLFSRPFS